MEKVATKNNLSDTTGNIFNIVESLKKKITSDSVKPGKSSKNFQVLTPGRKELNITVIARCWAASQFLPLF